MTHFAEPLDSALIRNSAKDEPCLIRLPLVCNNDPATTVLCHGRKYPGGGGVAIKPDDLGAAYGCYSCHCVVDGVVPLPDWLTRAQVICAFHDGHILTLRRLRAKGLIFTGAEWQPMESAPKDGSTFEVLQPDKRSPCVYAAWWDPPRAEDTPNGIEYAGGGWVLNDGSGFVEEENACHLMWRPLITG